MATDRCNEHSGCENQIQTNKKDIETLFGKITKIENRPPIWMSLAFTVAIGIISWLVKG